MNWYKLDVVRDALRLDHDAELAPTAIGAREQHIEVWRRRQGGETFITFLNCEANELLVPEEQLVAAAESLQISPARTLLESVKARGGLWLAPSPRS